MFAADQYAGYKWLGCWVSLMGNPRCIASTLSLLFLILRGVAQSGSARGLGPWGRRFESSHPDHFWREIMHYYVKKLYGKDYKTKAYCNRPRTFRERIREFDTWLKYGVWDYHTWDLDQYSTEWLYEHLRRFYDLMDGDGGTLVYNGEEYGVRYFVQKTLIALEEVLLESKLEELAELDRHDVLFDVMELVAAEIDRLEALRAECFRMYAALFPYLWE